MHSPDIVLIEGYKHGLHPKLELRRTGHDVPELSAADESVCMIVCDDPGSVRVTRDIPVLDRRDIKAIADSVLRCAVDQPSAP
jgi:molybdopterin-guanine dinucleotide biosynthesis protein